jgi:hypothetical protein
MDGRRKDDHLVEPLFAGLESAAPQGGTECGSEESKPARSPFWRTYRLLGICLAIVVWIALMQFVLD